MSKRKPVVFKIGGSVISDKEKKKLSIKSEIIERIADEIKDLSEKYRFYLVHGVGNAGHPPVRKYDLHHGFVNEDQLIGFTIAQNRVNKLRYEILETLKERNVPAIEFYPSSCIVTEDGRIKKIYSLPMEKIVKKGAVPVLSGDLVHDTKRGLAVCSGDVLVFELANIFDVKRILFGVDIAGVYSGSPQRPTSSVIEHISVGNLPKILRNAGKASGIDVSGGMEGKLRVMLRYKEFFADTGEVHVFSLKNPQNLRNVLENPTSLTFTSISA